MTGRTPVAQVLRILPYIRRNEKLFHGSVFCPSLKLANQQVTREPTGGWAPSWPCVLLGISAFVLQYDASGELADSLGAQHLPVVDSHGLDAVLAAAALATYAALDGTKQGDSMRSH